MEEETWDKVIQYLARYHEDDTYINHIKNARSHYSNRRECARDVDKLNIPKGMKIKLFNMIMARMKWAEAFEFAGYDGETKEYEIDYVPYGYLSEINRLLEELKQIV